MEKYFNDNLSNYLNSPEIREKLEETTRHANSIIEQFKKAREISLELLYKPMDI